MGCMEELSYLWRFPRKGVARRSTVNLFPHWCNGNYGEVCHAPPAEAGDTACRQLDQEWQRTRERVAVSTLTRACLLHTPGAPSHATLHPRRIRDAVPRPPARIAV